MARREWAEQIIAKHERKDDWGIECVSSTEVQRLLLKEHARAVRIVKRAKKLCIHPGVEHVGSLTCLAYQQACDDLLEMLQKGRA